MSQDKELFTNWERKILDEMVEVTALENAEKEGLEHGLEQGREERNEEIARNMVEDNVDIKTIVKYTGLDENKIWGFVASPETKYTVSPLEND